MAGGPRRSFAHPPAADMADHSVVGGGERELEAGGRPPATHSPAAKASVDSSANGGAWRSFPWGANPPRMQPPISEALSRAFVRGAAEELVQGRVSQPTRLPAVDAMFRSFKGARAAEVEVGG